MPGPTRLGRPRFWRAGLFLGSSLLTVALFLFTHQMVNRLTREVETTSRLFAQFCASASFPAARDPQLNIIFSDLVASLDFPIVITDTTGTPRAWRQVGVDPAAVPAEAIDSLVMGRPIDPAFRHSIEHVRARVAALDRRNAPIEMKQPGTGQRLGAVHYGVPPILETLRWMPYLSAIGVLLLLALGLWGLASIRAAEQRTIWVGMAKETAHQLGTPLSSLMGWVELLRGHLESVPPDGKVELAAGELGETLDEMDRDIGRLAKVAHRFSHVGSSPQLEPQDLTPVVREAVQYVRKRLPKGGHGIEITERYEEVPPVNLNPELLEWALENVLSNAVSALERRPGLIEVTVMRRAESETVEVLVRDNGRGMAPTDWERVFEPGFTTKPRGWGLGLALARRVIQDYHGGRIGVRDSAPGHGTTMAISFPT